MTSPGIRRSRRAIRSSAKSLLLAASGQVRNMATIGGNILQRTRCPYFRDVATPCNKREPGSGCSALGWHKSNARDPRHQRSVHRDPSIRPRRRARRARRRSARDTGEVVNAQFHSPTFHVVPGQHPERETVLEPGDLITAVDLPALPFARQSLYLKVRDRASFAFALASAAVALDVQSGTIRNARVALGGVGTKPWRSQAAERALIGKSATPRNVPAASAAALSMRIRQGQRFQGDARASHIWSAH